MKQVGPSYLQPTAANWIRVGQSRGIRVGAKHVCHRQGVECDRLSQEMTQIIMSEMHLGYSDNRRTHSLSISYYPWGEKMKDYNL